MPSKTVIAKNVTGSPTTIVGLGVTIAGGASYPLGDYFRLDEIQENASLAALINAGTLIINDGTADLSLAASLNWVTPAISDKDVNTELDSASATPAADVLARYDASGLLTLKETAGPTNLKLAAVADGQVLQRSGASIIGVTIADAANDSWKLPCRVASVANIPVLAGTLIIDGVTLVVGDRVLVKNQTTGSQNGIYVVGAIAWSRATDADTSAEMLSGTMVVVNEGTLNADSMWHLTTNNPIVLGTTALTWVREDTIDNVVFAEIAANTTSNSATYVPLLSTTITIREGSLIEALFTVGFSNTSANVQTFFRLAINGSVTRALGSRSVSSNQPVSGALAYRIAASPGAGTFTVTVNWRVSGGTGQVRPVSTPDGEFATLTVREVLT